VLVADPSWLIGAVPEGLVCVNRVVVIDVGFEATPAQAETLVGLMAGGVDAEQVSGATGTSLDESRDLLELLAARGVLEEDRAREYPALGLPLVEAIVAAASGDAPTGPIWTGSETLVVPEGLPPRVARRVLRAFVAGLEDHARLAAYGYAATMARRTVCGDAPDPLRLEAGHREARTADPGAIHILDLEADSRETISPDAFERLGGDRPHRLGALLKLEPDPWQGPLGRQRRMWSAQHAVPNLRHPGTPADRWGYGVGTSDERAQLVARAETIERYAAGDIAGHELVRACEHDLDGPVPPTAVFRLNARQCADHPELDPYDSDAAYLWTPVEARDGSRRRVVAQTVFFPFSDPERTAHLPPTSSSGVAAHPDPAEARTRALRELVERDHFMWTWVQGVSRERIDPRTLPADARELVALVEAAGHEVSVVNLSLDLHPVILCAAYSDSMLQLGCACHPDAGRAVVKAVEEAATGLDDERIEGAEVLEPRQVRGPLDHERFYRHPDRVAEAAFLFASAETIELADVPCFSEPIEDGLARIGAPLLVDLSSARTRPFHVVRTIVPGLIPISFGWDHEPLGVPRLAEPKTTADGRVLGRSLELADTGPILPHPFS
jgi:thiazole/oxazole-forming peptide maturase SagD family component